MNTRVRDENGKIREVSGLRVITSSERDQNGRLITRRYVQFVVRGRNHDWTDWCPYETFRRDNPKIRVAGA